MTELEEQATNEAIPASIEVWVCPNCGSYYASDGASDLTAKPNIRTAMRNSADEDPTKWGEVSGTRAECQHCRAAGQTVARIKVTYLASPRLLAAIGAAVEQIYVEEEKKSGTKLKRPD